MKLVRVALAKSILPVNKFQILVDLIKKGFWYVAVLHLLGTKVGKIVADVRVDLALPRTLGTAEGLRWTRLRPKTHANNILDSKSRNINLSF